MLRLAITAINRTTGTFCSTWSGEWFALCASYKPSSLTGGNALCMLVDIVGLVPKHKRRSPPTSPRLCCTARGQSATTIAIRPAVQVHLSPSLFLLLALFFGVFTLIFALFVTLVLPVFGVGGCCFSLCDINKSFAFSAREHTELCTDIFRFLSSFI